MENGQHIFIDYNSYQLISLDVVKLEDPDKTRNLTKYNLVLHFYNFDETGKTTASLSYRTGIQEDTVEECVVAFTELVKLSFFGTNKFSDQLTVLDEDANIIQETTITEVYSMFEKNIQTSGVTLH